VHGVFCITSLAHAVQETAPSPTPLPNVPVGFEAMQHVELLPVFLPNGTQTKQFITYDPAGENRSGFFKRYEENGEYGSSTRSGQAAFIDSN